MVTPPEEPLQEKNFIHEPDGKYPYWLWLFLTAVAAALLWGGMNWFQGIEQKAVQNSPFLQVTNRQISLFLWQFPQYMRANVKNKTVYMPGFDYQNKISILPGFADEYVSAPPEVLFMYHTWQRLVGNVYFPRPIPAKEFQEFLNYSEEWKPRNWPAAPQEYKDVVAKLEGSNNDLQNLSPRQLPMDVRKAFQGWKNFFKEGEAIENLQPTYEQVSRFLERAPKYARNYWRNLVMQQTPKYLDAFLGQDAGNKGNDPVSADQLTLSLKAAIYNYLQAQRGQ